MSTAWRFECPEGHVTLVHKQGHNHQKPAHRWYCQTCSGGYDRVHDKKTDQWIRSKPDG